jgi:hypothetical protein
MISELRLEESTKGVNVYLVGKITSDQWRNSLLVGEVGTLDSTYGPTNFLNEADPWPVARKAVRGGFHYVGPRRVEKY